jgi:hypothetical protein
MWEMKQIDVCYLSVYTLCALEVSRKCMCVGGGGVGLSYVRVDYSGMLHGNIFQ